ncbi:MAG: STAS domain-containing protein [Myxococcales bacterium]|nr:STAS domain-containing protein [Myxococcales bacterium]
MNNVAALDNLDPAAITNQFLLNEEEVQRLADWGKYARSKRDEVVESFYVWLRTQPEYEEFVDDPDTQRRLVKLQSGYIDTIFDAHFDQTYFENRIRVGTTHARIGLPLFTYFCSMNRVHLLLNMTVADTPEAPATLRAISKVVHMDTAIVALAYSEYDNQRVASQSKALLEMSTPVTEIWRGVLMLPIVGIIDSGRAQDIMSGALMKISDTRSRVFIMDISGVAVVDTAVANYLIKVTRATRLMGCECIVSGVSPAIAETIVELGIDVGTVVTTGTLMQALTLAFDRIGVRTVSEEQR